MALPLHKTEVLFLDIQATHPNQGYIFEMAWWFGTADAAKDLTIETMIPLVENSLIRPPAGETLPPAIKRITGIGDSETALGIRESRVRKALNKQLHLRLANQPESTVPTIIHYSRYEAPLLRKLYKRKQSGLKGFPFDIICTHQIISRLLPDLPRKGIRASAGYFDIHLPEIKRSAWHVAATAKIWFHLLHLLSEQESVNTYEGLSQWLSHGPKVRPQPKKKGRIYPMAKSNLSNIPDQPGVYRLRRNNGDLLYIGKATSLRQRLNSYFQKGAKHSERILEMLTQAQQLDFTVTANPLEAALRESDEIKEKSPIYNRALRGENRETVFFSRDLAEFSPTYQTGYPIGPLPNAESIIPLSMILRYIKEGFPKKINTTELERLFQVSLPYTPEAGMCRSGYHLFFTQHESAITTPPLLFALIHLGKQQWLKRLAELAALKEEDMQVEEEPDEEEEVEAEEIIEWTWTPERIARALEGMVRRGTFFLRRSRWFNLLCESAIGWQEQGRAEEMQVMVLRGGEVYESTSLDHATELPLPPDHGKQWPERRQQINYMTYERLRVLTTELKRMLHSSHSVAVRLSPEIILNTHQLKELVRWL